MGIFDFLKKNESKSVLDDAMSAMNAGGCTTDEMPNGIGEFGLEATNPIPVKYAASLMGLCDAEIRLPLTEPSDGVKSRVELEMKKVGLILLSKTETALSG